MAAPGAPHDFLTSCENYPTQRSHEYKFGNSSASISLSPLNILSKASASKVDGRSPWMNGDYEFDSFCSISFKSMIRNNL